MAKVANASDLKIDTNFDGTSNNDEPRLVVEALNRAQTNESVKSSTGESKSGSASRYRRRDDSALQIVDNFKLHAEVLVQRMSDNENNATKVGIMEKGTNTHQTTILLIVAMTRTSPAKASILMKE